QARLDAAADGRARPDPQGRRPPEDGQHRHPRASAGARRQMSALTKRRETIARAFGCLVAATLLAAPLRAQDLKPWRQAMIIPKADAGFFLMAAKRGFAEREGLKIDVLEVKDDPIGMKALLSGEVDSYEGVYGAIAAAARGADVKLLGCDWHAAGHGGAR